MPPSEPSSAELDLLVVMPVYNEQDSLPSCLASWAAVLGELDISWELLAINDGSSDNSEQVLEGLAQQHANVATYTKANEGHGPTILRGYQAGVERATWVFQVDSDDEMPASSFPEFWRNRDGIDAVFGVRTNREQGLGRKVISTVAATTARVAFGSTITDVNVPYRLMKSSVLAPILAKIPASTFAPNVVIAGAMSGNKASIVELPVPYVLRQTGEVSIAGLGAFKAAARSLLQTLKVSRRFRSS